MRFSHNRRVFLRITQQVGVPQFVFDFPSWRTMHRSTVSRGAPPRLDPTLPDDESLLVQLLEHLHYSGFVLDSPTPEEVVAGEGVLESFFEQEGEVLRGQLDPTKRQNFLAYLQQHHGPELRARLRQRIQRAFNQAARGRHHPVSLKRSVALGLQQPGHPLRDLLLLLEGYWALFLASPEARAASAPEASEPEQHYTPESLLQLRKQVQERLEGRQFVQSVLGMIAKQRGVSVETLTQEPTSEARPSKPRSHEPIRFVRPSNYVPERPLPASSESGTGVSQEPLLASASEAPVVDASEASSPPELLLEPDLDLGVPVADPPLPDLLSDQAEVLEEDAVPAPQPEVVQSVGALLDFEDDDYGEDPEIENLGLVQVVEDDADVVFGNGPITAESMARFVQQYPDSALKFLLRRDIDGRPLPREHEEVHYMWEGRDLKRPRLKRYILNLMGWEDFPDLPIHEILSEVRSKLFEMQHR